jgi:DNA-binding winged helix-turn-helix (wHTH) protein/tetratricopeptide (TPR) repeat protein
MQQDEPDDQIRLAGYCFAGVELDTATHDLRVDGRPVACSRKAFDLLVQLCRVPGRVQTRDELISVLWPGGQIVSDEALTQVIFRARAVLGRHAPLLLTVRGVGLRIDAEVQPLALTPGEPSRDRRAADRVGTGRAGAALASESAVAADAALPAIAADAVAVEQTPATTRRRWSGRWLWLLLAAAFAIVLLAYRLMQAGPVLVDSGYGLYESDLHAAQPGTAALIREAFRNDAIGERTRGQVLLQAVHDSDARTPVPSIFLALWASGVGDGEHARTWLAAARTRVDSSHDVYLHLLLDYVNAEAHGDAADVIRHAGAILDIRPEAWRMRSARSHLMSASGMREAALREVQQIEVPALGHRKLAMVIADRASMGDIEGAQALLDRLPTIDDSAAYAFLNGRIAWSRGDFDSAHRHFSEAEVKGFASARHDLHRRALLYIAAIEVTRHRDDAAIAALERARVGTIESGGRIDEIDASLFLAELHARAGRIAQMHTELERALQVSRDTNAIGIRVFTLLAARRLRPELDTAWPDGAPDEAEALWRARLAYNRGDRDAAHSALTEARHRGVFNARLADEARFLAQQLGADVPAERAVDPPFPPLAVFVLRRDIREATAGTPR